MSFDWGWLLEALSNAGATIASVWKDSPGEEGEYIFNDMIITSTNDYGLWDLWSFDLEEASSIDFETWPGDGEVGIMVELVDGEDDWLYQYSTVFEHDQPAFTSNEWSTTYNYYSVPALQDPEPAALEEMYAALGTLEFADVLDAAMVTIAEDAVLSAYVIAHPLNKIKSPEIGDDMFDALEKEEETQTVSVATTSTATVTYQE